MSVMGIEEGELEYLCNLGHWDFRSDDSLSSFCESDFLKTTRPFTLKAASPLVSSPLVSSQFYIKLRLRITFSILPLFAWRSSMLVMCETSGE